MKTKRFLSILLALTMVLTTISIGVFADEGAIANSGAPPVPNRFVNAAISVVSGKASPIPVNAMLSVPGKCPI